MLSYLVHYGLYPQPRGLNLRASQSPPRQLAIVGEWLHWPLSAAAQVAKLNAVRAYRSQLQWSKGYLYGFVRQDELLMRAVGATTLAVLETEEFTEAGTTSTASGYTLLSEYMDPVRDGVSRLVYAPADIAALHILRLEDHVWVAMDLRASTSHTVDYHLYVRAFSATDTMAWEERYGQDEGSEIHIHSDRVWFRLDRDTLGDPRGLCIAAETRKD